MADSLSPEESEEYYIESSAESSSSGPKSAESSSERETSIAAFSRAKPPSPSTKNDDDDDDDSEEEVEKEESKWTPYALSKTNVYTASSSLLTISHRSLSQRHSKPASADELLFHNPLNPDFVLPDSVKSILEDKSIVGDLPDSDLLKAVHRYVAEFFEAKGWEGVMGRAMDESALLAIGVILEEWGRDMVGKEGGMVFAE